MSDPAAIQYRVIVGKKQEIVDGPDDAELVISVPVAALGKDPTVAYMQGVLKAAGPSSKLFTALRSGEVATALSRLASPS
jgi:hypothetical protein